MPRAETTRQRAWAMPILLSLAGTAVCVPSGQAVAQEAQGLRGEVNEAAITAELLPGPALNANPGPQSQLGRALDVAAPSPAPSSLGARDTHGGQTANLTAPSPLAAPAPLPEFEEPETLPPAQPRKAAADVDIAPRNPTPRPAGSRALDTAATAGTVRTRTIDSVANEDLILDEGAEREPAIETLNRAPEENPFDAPGLRAGSFILRPSLEQGVTATSNADASAGGSSAVLSETTLRLNATSDWSEHTATVNAYGIFRKSLSGQEVSEAEGGIDADLQYDLGGDFSLNAGAGYAVRPESASSPDIVAGTDGRPLVHTLNGSLGLEKDAGKLRVGLTGRVERNIYNDADLLGGGTVSQEDRNSTLATATLRTGYEISPALVPFVELEVGRRFHDLNKDSAGYERSSLRTAARAGVAFDRGEKLSGELSAGWIREGFDDDRLAAISGASLNANVNWSPERGTTIGLTGSTTVEGATAPGESGSILYSGKLSAERRIRANLTGSAALGIDFRDYGGSNGRDVTLSAEGSLTWWLNRYAGLTGRLRHETLESNLPGRDAKASSVFLGVKVQR